MEWNLRKDLRKNVNEVSTQLDFKIYYRSLIIKISVVVA